MDRIFSLMHLSLVEKRQPSLLAFRGTREEWLRKALSESFEFVGYGGRDLVWVPRAKDSELIFGLVQGKSTYAYHEPPSLGGGEREDEFWQGAYIFLDPTHHDEGQKLAVENDVLGKPRALAKALFDSVNVREEAPYTCLPELIFDEDDFWSFAKKNNNTMKYIKFSFVVPNMWGPQSDLEKDLKDTGKETGSDSVEVTLKGSEGVGVNNDRVKTAVNYAGRGAGVVTAKSTTNKRFSSKKRATIEKVPKADLDDASEAAVNSIARRVLGRG